MKISAVVITRNEEKNIARCLRSLHWVDEIVLVDTESTDSTLDIACGFGARVFSMDWRGFGITKQYAVDQAKGDWILSVDADEVITKELAQEIQEKITGDNPADGYYLPRLTNFIQRWIYHSQWYPDYVLRLFKKGCGQFTAAMVHEEIIVDGTQAYLQNPMLHYSYPNLKSYSAKTKKYVKLGADDALKKGRSSGLLSMFVRPIVTFYRHFIFRLGFLDGWAGFFIGLLSANRNYHKYARIRKLSKPDS